ncbi:hypothetical protein [Solihabitans fulvus]|uniref:hypothetical protein n=1 Tax=Solihabitans fulvus TaxID=1892852 RepID=UPI001CB768A9|nr:hypothetical protein [Solihabitans fulvus]
MPPTRRRPTQPNQPPARRPRVAGLTNRPNPAGDETERLEATQESQESQDTAGGYAAPGYQPPGYRAPQQPARPQAEEPQEPEPAEPEATESEPAEPEAAEPAPEADDVISPSVIGAEDAEDAAAEDTATTKTAKTIATTKVAEDAETPQEAPEDASDGDSGTSVRPVDEPRPTRRPRLVTLAALLLPAVLFAGLAVWFHGEAEHLTSNSGQNGALVDTARTSEVTGQVKDAMEKAFSYNFADTASTEKAAKDLLTGAAVDQYNKLFEQVKKLAPEQKLVVSVRVVSSGVRLLNGDRAELLVFLDQTSTRTSDNQSSVGATMASVTAQRTDRWRISDLKILN